MWSSHMGYISKAEKWNWLHKNFVLSMLSKIKDEQFQVNKYSSVSSVIERIKAAIGNDRRLRSRIENLVSALSRSQEQPP
jgi:hypothetical protein